MASLGAAICAASTDATKSFATQIRSCRRVMAIPPPEDGVKSPCTGQELAHFYTPGLLRSQPDPASLPQCARGREWDNTLVSTGVCLSYWI